MPRGGRRDAGDAAQLRARGWCPGGGRDEVGAPRGGGGARGSGSARVISQQSVEGGADNPMAGR